MIPSGTRFGPYRLVDLLGAGGMGEVYRAHDERLQRDVALKVLPVGNRGNGELLRRFEQEARAVGALNHPNIVAVHDVGDHEGTPYIVSELLEGETLRERLQRGALPVRKAVDHAVQIARALAAAHDKGIVHRDVKPENLFVTNDGRVKVLDFGVAKLRGRGLGDAGDLAETAPGAVLGTVGYMSPEQVRGQAVDHRSDIFSLGAILYEMVTGARAFQGDSAVDTAFAILNDDPAELSSHGKQVPLALERIVHRCLEKRPDERFQSALDLAFDLEALSGLSEVGRTAPQHPHRRRDWRRWAPVGGAIVAAGCVGLAGYLFGARGRGASHAEPQPSPVVTTPTALEPPTYQQLTFRRGPVFSARFAPDGNTVVYSAAWEGLPLDVYTSMPGTPDSRSLGLADTDLAAVSSRGELAVLVRTHRGGFIRTGTLARVPITGGPVRELVEGVTGADWSPDGETLAVVRSDETGDRLESPPGRLLYQSEGWISHIRYAPTGDAIAFVDHAMLGDDHGEIATVDLDGVVHKLAGPYASAQGLAWSPDGSEVWFTAADFGVSRTLWAASLDGRKRVLARAPGTMTLHDVSASGRVLMVSDHARQGIMAIGPDGQARDLSWYDWSLLADISPDGKQVLILESGEGAGRSYGLYLRPSDGSPAVKLGNGTLPAALSQDGKWVAHAERSDRHGIVLQPTGPGDARQLPVPADLVFSMLTWAPDGQSLLAEAADGPGEQARVYKIDVADGHAEPISAPLIYFSKEAKISPDGRWYVGATVEKVTGEATKIALYPIDGGDPRAVVGWNSKMRVVGWTADSTKLYVLEHGEPVSPGATPAQPAVYRLDPANGHKQLVRHLEVPGGLGTFEVRMLFGAAEAQWLAFSYWRELADLYLVDGVT